MADSSIGTLRGLCMYKFDIPGCSMLAAHKTGCEIVSPGRPEFASKGFVLCLYITDGNFTDL